MQQFSCSQKQLAKIFKKYGVTCAYLFGSTARGNTHAKSDIDIAVRFARKLPLKKFLALGSELSRACGGEADIVDLDQAPLPLQFRIFRERKILFNDSKQEAMKRARALDLYYDYKYYYDRFSEFELNRILKKGLA